MTNLLDALSKERAQLVSELSRDPRYIKLQKIDELLATYKRVPAEQNEPVKRVVRLRPQSVAAVKQPSKRVLIEAAIRSFLNGKASTHRRDILDHLTAQGLMGEEKNPIGRLAIYLSDMEGISGDGTGNWALIDQPNKANEKGLFE
jgi:hypothetical protein